MLSKIIEKLLGPKAAPTRAALEKAITEAETERARAERAVADLTAKRRDILLRASDLDAAAHDSQIATEQRAADRAAVLVEELEGKLQEVAEREREEAIAAARKVAEEKIEAGLAALAEYPEAARRVAELAKIVDAAEVAAKAFNSSHPDEPPLLGPEGRVRWIPPSPRRELKRERLSLWARQDGTPIEPGSDLEPRIIPSHSGVGSLFTGGGHRNEFYRRDFDRVTFAPDFSGAVPLPLVRAIVLPGLTATDAPILDAERRLPPPARKATDPEVEYVPVRDVVVPIEQRQAEEAA